MNDAEVFRWMKRFGYLPDVKLSELQKLDTESRDARHGLQLVQSAVYTEEQIGLPDGVLGDYTRATLTQPRCGHPDFPDSEIRGADSRAIAEALQISPEEAQSVKDMHHSLEDSKAIGSGSWPMPCQKEGVTVSYDTSRAPRGLDTDKLFAANAKAYADIGVRLVRHTGGGRANIRVTWEVLQGSVIGLAQFNSQRCSDSIFCKLDPGYFPNFLQVGGLFQHELGHNMNLEHTRGGVMNPSITQFREIVWSPSDPSYRTLTRFFGGEPVDPVPGPGPDPPTPIPVGEGQGVIVFDGQIYEIKQTLKKT
jgi:hypothetical protein